MADEKKILSDTQETPIQTPKRHIVLASKGRGTSAQEIGMMPDYVDKMFGITGGTELADEADTEEKVSGYGVSWGRLNPDYERIIVPDGLMRPVSQKQKEREELLALIDSAKTGSLLVGRLDYLKSAHSESTGQEYMCGAVIYGHFEVLIPLQALVPPELYHTQESYLIHRARAAKRPIGNQLDRERILTDCANHMLGSVLHFRVRGVDVDTLTAFASHHEAMSRQRNQYFGRMDDVDGTIDYTIRKGTHVGVNIIATYERAAVGEVCGMATVIPVTEMTWKRGRSHSGNFVKVGETSEAVVTEVTRNSKNEPISLKVSIKELEKNQPQIRLMEGSRVRGHVTGYKDGLIFARTGDDLVSCVLTYNPRIIKRPAVGSSIIFQVSSYDPSNRRCRGKVLFVDV